MGDDLMTEKIEINPVRARSSFGTTEQLAVKGARLGKIAHGKGEMKSRPRVHAMSLVK
jgi:hypothetical protein